MTVVQQDVLARLRDLLLVDSLPWRCEWAAWRMRFAYDNDVPETSFKAVARLLRERGPQLCNKRAEAVDNVLYMLDFSDAKTVFQSFWPIQKDAGQISDIQSRAAYEDAMKVAAELAQAAVMPDSAAERDAMTLPDITWDVEGTGMARVASAVVLGHKIVVRLGRTGGGEMWVVDVRGRAACAQFRARGDAVSKVGVAMALRAYERMSVTVE